MKKLAFNAYTTTPFLPDFNDIHETNFQHWEDFWNEIGTTPEACFNNPQLEYRHYCDWVDVQNSPLMKALK